MPVWIANEKDPSTVPNDYASWINYLQKRIPVCAVNIIVAAWLFLFLPILCEIVNHLKNQGQKANDFSQYEAINTASICNAVVIEQMLASYSPAASMQIQKHLESV